MFLQGVFFVSLVLKGFCFDIRNSAPEDLGATKGSWEDSNTKLLVKHPRHQTSNVSNVIDLSMKTTGYPGSKEPNKDPMALRDSSMIDSLMKNSKSFVSAFSNADPSAVNDIIVDLQDVIKQLKGLIGDQQGITWYDDGSSKAYADIENLCHDKGMRFCFFDEVCPNGGPFQDPAGGQQYESDMWSPIRMDSSSMAQDWVQVGTRDGGMCNLLTSYHAADIEGYWMTTNEDTYFKKIYPCCVQHILWYDDGSSKAYADIENLCHDRGMRFCFFDEVCPNGGPFQDPTGGQQYESDMWSPIRMDSSSMAQDWVQVGTRDGGMCNLLTSYHAADIEGYWMTTNQDTSFKKIYPCCVADISD